MRLLASEGKGFQVYNDGKNKLSCDNDDERGAMIGTFLFPRWCGQQFVLQLRTQLCQRCALP
jgi:hypothetical protein